ncbi:MAG: DUF167 family protein [Gammaproteobacteria bacterium]|nr:DUF167 family protein [Gammaproteobacteria bacterium]
MADSGWYRWDNDDLLIKIRLQPNAGRDEVAGVQDNCLKISVTSQPVEGKANRHLVSFLSKLIRMPKTHLILVSGDRSKIKLLRIKSAKKRASTERLQTLGILHTQPERSSSEKNQ